MINYICTILYLNHARTHQSAHDKRTLVGEDWSILDANTFFILVKIWNRSPSLDLYIYFITVFQQHFSHQWQDSLKMCLPPNKFFASHEYLSHYESFHNLFFCPLNLKSETRCSGFQYKVLLILSHFSFTIYYIIIPWVSVNLWVLTRNFTTYSHSPHSLSIHLMHGRTTPYDLLSLHVAYTEIRFWYKYLIQNDK